jgi:hypothetical protein
LGNWNKKGQGVMGLLQMSFTGAILIIVVAAIRVITVNKLPKQVT